jgi:hypothetical protein
MNAKAKKPSVMEHLTERIVSPEKEGKPAAEVTELLSVRLPFDTFSSIEAVRKHLKCTRTEAARMLLDAAWQLLREQVGVKDKEQQKLLDEIKKRLIAERGGSAPQGKKAG